MKNLFIILFIANIIVVNSIIAQNLPIAVNDTFYIDFRDTTRLWWFNRSTIVANDTLGSGTAKIIDTVSYNGLNQVDVVMNSNLAFGVSRINYIISAGFFGLDSITYYFTDNGVPTGFDTAFIYIYVKRKAYENIDLNNINAAINKDVLFQNTDNWVANYNVPKQLNSSDPFYNSIYAANPWFAGLNSNGELKGLAETYLSNNLPPIAPWGNYTGNAGPLMDSVYYEKYSYEWDRVWKVSAIDIQNHLAGINTTEAILSWPTHGNVAKGQAQNLATFVDVDFDGIYNPSLGDYPKIKGQQAIYFIKNSERSVEKMKVGGSNIEIHGLVYVYDCPEDSAINNTVFVDYTVYNRSTSDLTDCYFGQWVDFDLGNSNDDALGCDVSRGVFYVYNGDNNDESANGVAGYGVSPPAQGVTFLKGAKQANDGIDNPLTSNISTAISQNGIPYAGLGIGFGDGVIDNEYLGLSHFMSYNIGNAVNGNGAPKNGANFYSYLQGMWLDSSQVTCNGVPINYMLGGDSDSLNWNTQGVSSTVSCSEIYAGNYPTERRCVGSTGPFTLLAGESVEMELAFVFGWDYFGTNNLSSIVVMQERVDSIRSYHANGFATTLCGGSIIGVKEAIEKVKEIIDFSIYPNPFSNQFLVNYNPSLTTSVEVYNLLGGKVLTQQITQHLTLLDLSNQPNGVYFVRVTDGKVVLTKKVMKQ